MPYKATEQQRARNRAACARYRATHRDRETARHHAYASAHQEQERVRRRLWAQAHPEQSRIADARKRAKRDGVPCTLTIADVRAILEPMRCSATGLPLAHAKGSNGPAATSPSLDRIVPALGYVPGNVRLVCHRFNALRKDAPVSRDAEFRGRVLAELGEVQP